MPRNQFGRTTDANVGMRFSLLLAPGHAVSRGSRNKTETWLYTRGASIQLLVPESQLALLLQREHPRRHSCLPSVAGSAP